MPEGLARVLAATRRPSIICNVSNIRFLLRETAGQGLLERLRTADINQLARPDSEGNYLSQCSPEVITYVIEKDFPCVQPSLGELMEAQSETFPAPPGFQERKSSAIKPISVKPHFS